MLIEQALEHTQMNCMCGRACVCAVASVRRQLNSIFNQSIGAFANWHEVLIIVQKYILNRRKASFK